MYVSSGVLRYFSQYQLQYIWIFVNILKKCDIYSPYNIRSHDFKIRKNILEMPGIDPGTSRMLSERSTIWATPPWIISFQGTLRNHKPY